MHHNDVPKFVGMIRRTIVDRESMEWKSRVRLGLKYFRLDNGSPIKRSRLTELLTDAAKWCSGGWKTGTLSLSDLLRP